MKITNDVATDHSWVKYTATYANFQPNGGNSGILTVGQIPAGAVVMAMKMKHSISFSGGTIATATVASTPYFPIGFNVFSAPGDTNGTLATGLSGSILNHSSTTPITLTLTVSGDVIDSLTTGSVDLWLKYETVK